MQTPALSTSNAIRQRVRWACRHEVLSPKLGNVFPGYEFPDLTVRHFLDAAEITADALTQSAYASLGDRVLRAIRHTRESCGTNVNLGIVLLLAPLVMAAERGGPLRAGVRDVLAPLTAKDTADVYAAIALAQPGGMGDVDEMDIADTPPISLVSAMRSAAQRDRIAMQYAHDFSDLFDTVLPVLRHSFTLHTDAGTPAESQIARSVTLAQWRLLCDQPDSLIARVHGESVAHDVCRRCAELSLQWLPAPTSQRDWIALDAWMRSGQQGKKMNPGTTAD
ncbi:MAG: triphosphoribosyl-dephospho-CoA synthase, partial [Planctomycetota bacterium]